MNTPYLHEADQYFVSLVDYLRHLVDVHDIEETPELWRSGRERFDELHAIAHDEPDAAVVSPAKEPFTDDEYDEMPDPIVAMLTADEVTLVLQLGTGRDSCPPWWSPEYDALLDRLREQL